MKIRLFFAALIILSLACSQLTPATTIPTQDIQATELPATEASATQTLEIIQTPEATPTPEATEAPEIAYGAIAREHITTITEKIGGRWSGTEKEIQTGQYIETEFVNMGYEPEVVPFSRMGWTEDESSAMFNSANVVAVKQGSSAQVIVVGAHYDSVEAGLGADDNASGVGILLELATLLKDVPAPYTIHFVAFGAEEAGMLGSQNYVDNLNADEIKNTIGFVNLDSVIAGDNVYVYCSESLPALRDWAMDWAKDNGFGLQAIPGVDLSDEGYGTADYDAFQKAHIPFAYFEATNWSLGDQDGYTQVDPQYGDYGTIIHTQYDTLEYIDETFPGRVDEHLNGIVTILYNLLTQYATGN